MNTKFLDGTRFLLSLWVVVAHFYTLAGGAFLHVFPARIQYFISFPIDAVYGFMIITGFLMAYNYINRSEKEKYNSKSSFYKFWLRRFFRLYPVYIVAIFVTFLLFTTIAANNAQNLLSLTGTTKTAMGVVRQTAQPGLSDLLSHVFLIHGMIPAYHDSILGVTWSLSLEMQFYFIFPFLFLFLLRDQQVFRQYFLLLLITSAYIAYKVPQFFGTGLTPGSLAHFKLPSFLPYAFPLFLLGIIIAAVGLKKVSYRYLFYILVIVILLQDVLTTFVIVFLIVLLFIEEVEKTMPAWLFKIITGVNKMLSGRLAEAGANISYSMYLIHTTIISFVLRFVIQQSLSALGKRETVVIALILTLIVTFIISHILYVYIEKPCIKYGRSFIENRFKNNA